MKKLIKQPSNILTQPIENEESKDNSDSKRIESFKKRNIPDLSQFDIKKIDDLKTRLDKMKMENNQSDFSQSIQSVLDLYDDSELHYSENIVFFVMSEIEKFILKPKSGQNKEKVVVEACKKYFNN